MSLFVSPDCKTKACGGCLDYYGTFLLQSYSGMIPTNQTSNIGNILEGLQSFDNPLNQRSPGWKQFQKQRYCLAQCTASKESCRFLHSRCKKKNHIGSNSYNNRTKWLSQQDYPILNRHTPRPDFLTFGTSSNKLQILE